MGTCGEAYPGCCPNHCEFVAHSVTSAIRSPYELAIRVPDDANLVVSNRPLAFLPIHAAGKYIGGSDSRKGVSMFDYAISSYTSTISALTGAVKRSMPMAGPSGPTDLIRSMSGLLLVNQSNAPGLEFIPGATEEHEASLACPRTPVSKRLPWKGNKPQSAPCSPTSTTSIQSTSRVTLCRTWKNLYIVALPFTTAELHSPIPSIHATAVARMDPL